MQDVNIAEQMVDRGFAKWTEHTAELYPPLSVSHYDHNCREDMQRTCVGDQQHNKEIPLHQSNVRFSVTMRVCDINMHAWCVLL